MSCFSYFVAVLWESMNELQRLIRQSFDTKKKIYPAWHDPDGIFHEESVSYITPYCEDMDELAVKCGLSRSQLYRKLADHKAKFKPHELEELHKQLHWHDHRDFMGDLMVDIEATKQIITHSRRQQAMDEALEDFDGDKNPAGAFGSAEGKGFVALQLRDRGQPPAGVGRAGGLRVHGAAAILPQAWGRGAGGQLPFV